ncbi:MAG: sugar ABC transporter permease [Actinomycetaceae bacterium]|nr:sugar ABC transporter permease [Actinomycetaceae bacterium]
MAKTKIKLSKRQASQQRMALMLVTPTVILIGVVILWPVLQAIINSFFGQPGMDADGFFQETSPFVALDNYASAFGDSRFFNALFNTTLFAVITVSLETILGMAMALIMNQAIRGRGVLRAAILIPWAVPTAVSAVLWKWIFDAHGVANSLIGKQILWATGDWTAKSAIIIADVWKTAPFIGLLVLAGLQIIPEDVYEAAKIDGANVWKRFTSITLPLVRPALVVAVLFRSLDALRMFDLPYILIGARKQSVETLSMLVQDHASNLRYGAASANAMLLFAYIFVIVLVFVKILGADIIGSEGSRDSKGSKLRLFSRRAQAKRRKAANEAIENTEARKLQPVLGGSEG